MATHNPQSAQTLKSTKATSADGLSITKKTKSLAKSWSRQVKDGIRSKLNRNVSLSDQSDLASVGPRLLSVCSLDPDSVQDCRLKRANAFKVKRIF